VREEGSVPILARELKELRGFLRLLRTREALVLLTGAVLIVGYELHKGAFYDELGQTYYFLCWHGATFVLLGLVPIAICLLASWPLKEMGLGLGEPRIWGPYLGLMVAIMAPVVIIASRFPSFYDFYPMIKGGVKDSRVFWISEASFLAYWFGWEFYFRGFLIWGTVRRLGAYAILLPVAAFALTHLRKPELECWASIPATVILGWVSYRGRSIWPCFLIHWGSAFAMDLLAKFGR
jgi:hypothetical protein